MHKNKRLKIIYIINHASFFTSHRLDLFNYTRKYLDADAYLVIGQPGSDKMEKIAFFIINLFFL